MGPTFFSLVEKAAAEHGGREFLFDGTYRLSFSELHARSLSLAKALYARGLRPGDAFLTFIPNWVEYVITYAAVTACGAVFASASMELADRQFRHAVTLINPKMVQVAKEKHVDELASMEFLGEIHAVRLEDPRCDSYEILEETAPELSEFAPVAEQDVSTVLFTSGSTGFPKGVMCTAFALDYIARRVGESLHLTTSDTYYMPLSWCHVFGLSNGLYGPLVNGCRIVTGGRFNPETAIELIQTESCTVQLGVPTMFLRQLKVAKRTGQPIPLRCGITGGSGRNPELIQDYEEYCGAKILPSYGMTEMTGGISATDIDAPACCRYDSDGAPLPGVEFIITDSYTEDFGMLASDPAQRDAMPAALPANVRGQICLKSIGVMGGYYCGGAFVSNPELKSQWFPTGDIGFMDERNYVHVTGRLKDIIIRGGLNIDPQEVESEYIRLTGVMEACLVGYPDDELGERSCLFVTPTQEEGRVTLDTNGLRAYAYSRVEKHKVPDKVVVIDEMPRLKASSKIDKRALEKMASDLLEATR